MDDKQKPRVAICVPSQKSWDADMALVFGSITARAAVRGIPTITINEKSSLVWQARNSMVTKAKSFNATHILWIDSDMVPPPEVVSRLLSHEKDIVGSPYPKRIPPYEILGIPAQATRLNEGGLVPYWLLPGGCVMVSMNVYDAIPEPWYFDTIRRPGKPVESFLALMEDHYRIPMPDAAKARLFENSDFIKWLHDEEQVNVSRYGGHKTISEDYNFCLKAMRHGFKIFADLDLMFELAHIGEQQIMCQRDAVEEKVLPIQEA